MRGQSRHHLGNLEVKVFLAGKMTFLLGYQVGPIGKKGLPMILQTLSSLALHNDMYMPMAFTVASS